MPTFSPRATVREGPRGGESMEWSGQRRVLTRTAVVFLAVVLAAGYLPVRAQPAIPTTIKIGALFDTTGPTSDVGVDYSKGVPDHVRYINEVEGGRSEEETSELQSWLHLV